MEKVFSIFYRDFLYTSETPTPIYANPLKEYEGGSMYSSLIFSRNDVGEVWLVWNYPSPSVQS